MARYIKCDCCGKKIKFGDVALTKDLDGVYCSDECFTDAFASAFTVNEESAYDCGSAVYDDEARKEEIRKEMEEHKQAIEELLKEFELLTAQN